MLEPNGKHTTGCTRRTRELVITSRELEILKRALVDDHYDITPHVVANEHKACHDVIVYYKNSHTCPDQRFYYPADVSVYYILDDS